ncbi:MAG TPA: Stp1/IreP family PP2C-type Ser/Thr phosphatase [Sphingobacteriaceae bacterium]|nr:Stp1/IreP family PP2C-type Ser/Thr phosphatase [Sphingobacteriaceae bacterium]
MLLWFAATDIGRVRTANQDAYAAFSLPQPAQAHVFAVADGMGGAQAGDVASSMALHVLEECLAQWNAGLDAPPSPGDVMGAMEEALVTANDRLVAEAARDPSRAGMGTTLTAAYVKDLSFVFAHVGDSRLYKVFPDGRMEQLTVDHALVTELVRSGQITAEQARTHPQRHILTEALGLARRPQVQTAQGSLEAGEGLLLCTDGLTSTVTDAEIGAALVEQPHDPHRLIALANQRGAPDNVTLLVVWPGGGGSP